MFKKSNIFTIIASLFVFATIGFGQNSNANVSATPAPRAMNAAANAPKPRKSPKPRNANVAVNAVNSDYIPPPPEPPANSTVRGRVYYSDTGRPVKRASVMLFRKEGGGREIAGLTDGEGMFEIKNLPAGTYFPTVNSPGIVSFFSSIDLDLAKSDEKQMVEQATQGVVEITVNGISDLDVQIAAYRGGAISGRVLYANGDPAIGVSVQILRKKNDEFQPIIISLSPMMLGMMNSGGSNNGSITDDRGIYRFAALPAGEYIIKATENVVHGEKQRESYGGMDSILLGNLFGGSSFLTAYFPDVFEARKAQVVNVELGQEVAEINVQLPDLQLRKVTGKILTVKENKPRKATITIERIEGDNPAIVELPADLTRSMKQSTQSNEEGIFKFKELPNGNYKLTIEPDNVEVDSSGAPVANKASNIASAVNSNRFQNANRSLPRYQKYAKRTFEFSIEDNDVEDIIIEIGFGATISGTVFIENSVEMPNYLSVKASNKKLGLNDTTSVENYVNRYNEKDYQYSHNFMFSNISPGKIDISIDSSNDDYYVKSIRSGNLDLLTKPIEMSDGDVVSNVQIILAKDFGTLNGKVFDAANDIAKGVQISIIPTDSIKRKLPNFYELAFSNESGEFSEKLAPGEYAVMIIGKENVSKKGEMWEKWLDEAIKDAPKVMIEAGKSASVSVKVAKK
jgi:Carboxypeptidase regulatory-like domain